MKKVKIKYDLLLFALLMVFLFVPIVQHRTGIFPVKPLKGAIEPTPKPELTFDSYRSNTYQAQAEKYVSENFGLREPVIRIYNQYVWSAYNKTYCHFIVPGKQDYLYYALAVNEHYGIELLKHYESNEEAMNSVEKELRLMCKLRHALKDYGIEFVAFIAPDKPEVYPEYLPRCDADTTTVHLTEYYSRLMDEVGFPYINMTDWFVSMRDTVSFPLFPKTDSHWRYSAVYAYDSLFRFMNTLDGEAKFPKIHIGPPIAYESDKLEGDEETLNHIFPIRGGRTKYKSEITVEDEVIEVNDSLKVEDQKAEIAPMPLPALVYPRFAVSTNLAYDLYGVTDGFRFTPNISLEFPIGNKWSTYLEYTFPWWVSNVNNQAWQILKWDLGTRYWLSRHNAKDPMDILTGHFVGIDLGAGYYDIEPLHKGWQGEFQTVGLEYGYAWRLGRAWRLDAYAGAGWLGTHYRYYEGDSTDQHLLYRHHGKMDWFGPVKAGISIKYIVHAEKRRAAR